MVLRHPVWRDIRIKSSLNVPKVAQNVATSGYINKKTFSKKAQKVIKYLGFFCEKFVGKSFQKSPNLVTLGRQLSICDSAYLGSRPSCLFLYKNRAVRSLCFYCPVNDTKSNCGLCLNSSFCATSRLLVQQHLILARHLLVALSTFKNGPTDTLRLLLPCFISWLCKTFAWDLFW